MTEKWVEDYKSKRESYEEWKVERDKKDTNLLSQYFSLIREFKKGVGLDHNNITHTDLTLYDLPKSHPKHGGFKVEFKLITHSLGGFFMYNVKDVKSGHYVYMSERDIYGEFYKYLRGCSRDVASDDNGDMFWCSVWTIAVLIFIAAIFIFI